MNQAEGWNCQQFCQHKISAKVFALCHIVAGVVVAHGFQLFLFLAVICHS